MWIWGRLISGTSWILRIKDELKTLFIIQKTLFINKKNNAGQLDVSVDF